jgi:hypothetical protein
MTQSDLIPDTAENRATILALKALSNTIGKIYWHGNTVHDTLDKCLRALNNQSNNSGWYNPIPTRINGANGIYMINESGSIFWEARIIKEGEKQFRIEYLCSDGDRKFEQVFRESMENEYN